ncbi:pitrilysin family protein [Helicobacter sp. MIT 14-3879]|uniref:M16 family metallopeptidase n=1 Tax=Helicobacter sp. MIT 14-3879 TaxID=2040649 RepID=UPI000E1E9E89|nr:pitrilysin family protein [Helicobacter sp. MIT 14-3879]RDU65244.1 peptidase M16 [Helicobacter sp. MIT 14-3879]
MSSYVLSSSLYKYDEINLDNGLKVVVIPMKNDSKVVDVNIFYKVGSRNEILGKSGIAHMLEHMNFKSTKKLKSGEFDNIVKRFGGNTNASTGFDYTRYFVKSNVSNLDKILELFSEMMQNLSLKDSEFQTERNVVSEERLWRTDNNPMGYLYFRLFNTAYIYHPYHWTPIGFMEDIKSWNIEDIRDFYNTYYQPQNAIIVVAGDVESKVVFDSAKKYFNKIKNKSKIPSFHTIEPKQNDKRFIEIKRENQELELYALAFKIPNFEHKDQITLSILSNILSNGKSSILVENMINKEKIAQSVYAYNMELKDDGLFIFMASGNENIKAETLQESMLKQIESIKNGNISEKELLKAKINIKADFIYGLENSSQVASLYGEYFAMGNIQPLLEYEYNFDKITKDDVVKVANKYFTSETSTTIFLRK